MARMHTIKAIKDVFTEHGLSFMNDASRIVIVFDGEPRDRPIGHEY